MGEGISSDHHALLESALPSPILCAEDANVETDCVRWSSNLLIDPFAGEQDEDAEGADAYEPLAS